MNLFGFTIKRAPAGATPVSAGRGGWGPIIREADTGYWQRNIEWTVADVLAYPAAFACVARISQDIAKLRVRLVALQDGIWRETTSPAFSPVLAKPNPYQTRIQFFESWMVSKLTAGNCFCLKERDGRGVVVAIYVLNPKLVTPLVAPSGDVYYRLGKDALSQVTQDDYVVPASEVIHDRAHCLYHPLVGVSPLYAAGLAAAHGQAIAQDQAKFATNGSMPGGFLTTPARISDETAQRLKSHFDTGYTGENRGRIAVLGDGLKFEVARTTAADAEIVAQSRMAAEAVCTAFNVPAFMVGVGEPPAYSNVEALNQQYYSQTLQSHIEAIELCLDEGLGLAQAGYGSEFDLNGLLRMDSATKIEALSKGVGGGIHSPNEARALLDLPPVEGGDTPYLQQQNYSLSALDRRDQQPAPSDTPTPVDTPTPDAAKYLTALLRTKRLEDFAHA